MSDESTALAVYEAQSGVVGMVRPLTGASDAALAIQEYEALKAAIIQPGDIQQIQGRDFLKKAFWRRVATCFGLSLDLVSEQRGHDETGKLYYSVLYRAVAPNGRSMIGDGYCSTAEPKREAWPEHNVRATAHTRAKNRAISDLVGGGEVSADEIIDGDERPAQPQQRRQAQRPQPVRQTHATPPADADAGTWAALRRSALDIAPNMADWETLCREATGKTDSRTMVEADKAKVADLINQRKRDHAATQAAAARVPEDALEGISGAGGRH